ncbi:uncharacterized protein LOC111831537 [Capsella rubella]|uniref:uncharacterized protein LOC111831537 n=1 Tax=Capsella rubella TaxID=81985 RepID=UPI000CD56069|nr:uncharacterized protein LOC111831537 [Capsella rubella]
MAQMRSQVHLAISAAPDIDRVIEETRRTPFTDRIAKQRLRDMGKLRLPEYAGTSDPRAHLRAFRLAITRAYLTDEESEAGYCRYFAENLVGPTLEWFASLEASSIDSFDQLAAAFLKQYSVFFQTRTTELDLWLLVQARDQPLREYISKFRETKARIANLNDEVALAALRHGLWYTSKFREELTKKNEQPKAPFLGPRKGPKKDSFEPGQHNYAVEATTRSRSPNFDPEKFCKFHKVRGHSTEECRSVGRLLAKKHEAGEFGDIDLELEGEKAREAGPAGTTTTAKRDRTIEEEGSPPPAPKKRIDLVFANLRLCQSNTNSVTTPPPAPRKNRNLRSRLPSICTEPETVKRVDYITGGSSLCRNSINLIKAYQRRLRNHLRERKPRSDPDYEITFWESETYDLDKPHDDALVVRLDVGRCELSRIMIETGSYVDLLFYEAYKQMGYPDSELRGARTPLTGFAGDTTLAKGTVQLIVEARGVRKLVDFVVVEPFNAILGRPWLYEMKAVPSTYHQCVKFPARGGIATIFGSQRTSRKCYMGGYEIINKSPQ